MNNLPLASGGRMICAVEALCYRNLILILRPNLTGCSQLKSERWQ